jgi:hypothetical protein
MFFFRKSPQQVKKKIKNESLYFFVRRFFQKVEIQANFRLGKKNLEGRG